MRPHQAAHEAVAGLSTVLVEHHADSQAGAVLAGLEAAQAVGQDLGQHGLDPVGEVGRVALGPRLAVQRRAGPDIGGDIGDGDPDDPAAFVLRILVALGVDGVVVIAGVGRVDGDEGDFAQVLAPLQRRQGLVLGLALHGFGEAGRHAVRMDGQQGGGAGIVLAADGLQNLAALGAVAVIALFDGGQHQVAVAQILGLNLGHHQHVLGPAVHRLDPRLARRLADDAQHAVGRRIQPLDQARLPAVLAVLELDQQAVAHARSRGVGLSIGHQQRARRIRRGVDQPDVQFAVGVPLDHVGHADRRQGAGFGEALAAALAELALGLKLADHLAQGASVAALQAEVAGDVGLLGRSRLTQEGDQRVLVGEACGRPLG